MDLVPRDRRGWVLEMLRPTLVELDLLLWSEGQCCLALDIGEAVPQRDRKLSPFGCGKSEQRRVRPGVLMWMA